MKFIQTPGGTYISINNIIWFDKPYEYCHMEEGKEVSTWKIKLAFRNYESLVTLEFVDLHSAEKFIKDMVES